MDKSKKYVTKMELEAAMKRVVTSAINQAGKIADKDIQAAFIEKLKEDETYGRFVDLESVVMSRIDASRPDWLKGYLKSKKNKF